MRDFQLSGSLELGGPNLRADHLRSEDPPHIWTTHLLMTGYIKDTEDGGFSSLVAVLTLTSLARGIISSELILIYPED